MAHNSCTFNTQAVEEHTNLNDPLLKKSKKTKKNKKNKKSRNTSGSSSSGENEILLNMADHTQGSSVEVNDMTESVCPTKPLLSTANRCGVLASVLMPVKYNSWTVLSNPSALVERGYRGHFLCKSVALPLPLTFRTPR